MPLKYLDLHSCQNVSDLTPLKGMPLTFLRLTVCKKVSDLSPLEGMKLVNFHPPPTVSKGLDVVRTMSSLAIINDKPAAQFWKEYDAAKGKK
jgi:hypothetical protein